MSVVPVDTEYGRKRWIDQSSCNKDYSCVEGFCPSFVTVHGGNVRKGKGLAGADQGFGDLPEPTLPSLHEPWGILVTGVGGTGVVTIGALLGIAANLENKGITVLDMAGLAQKGGPVWSHIRIAERPDQLYATRISTGEANAIIGCDIIVTVADETLARMQAGVTRAVVNSDFSVTSDFVRTFGAQASTGDLTRYRDPQFPLGSMEQQITEAVGPGNADFVAATQLATALMGDSIATNPFMLGYAYQKGLLPISGETLLKAIEVHGVAVQSNKKAFLWGRRAAHDLAAVEKAIAPAGDVVRKTHQLSKAWTRSLLVVSRISQRTKMPPMRVGTAHSSSGSAGRSPSECPARTQLTEAVAGNYYKLLAYKDEYEVARLYTDPDYLKQLNAVFEGDFKLTFHMAPPILAKPDPVTGEARKRPFGPWMMSVFKVLAKLKRLARNSVRHLWIFRGPQAGASTAVGLRAAR